MPHVAACLPPPPPTSLPLPLLQLHYQHQVVQHLHSLWRQYMVLPLKAEEARPGEEHLGPRAQAAATLSAYSEETSMKIESSAHLKGPTLDPQLPRRESEALRDSQDHAGSQKTGLGVRHSQRKSIMEEILVEGSPDPESIRSPWELDGLPLPEWNLCLEDFRKVPSSPGTARCPCFCSPFHPHGQRNNLLRTQIKQSLGLLFILGALATVVQEELLL